VPGSRAAVVLARGEARERDEAGKRQRYAAGELGLDVGNMRPRLLQEGLRYVEFGSQA
jgi:4-hydroxy-4-methyl-2-oxoglutarate aldolase